MEAADASARQDVATVIRGNASIQSASILSLVVGVALVVVLGWLFARWITRPIHYAIQMLRDIAQGEGDLTRRLDETRHDEFGELAQCFRRETARHRARYRRHLQHAYPLLLLTW